MKKEKSHIVSLMWIKRINDSEVLENTVDMIDALYPEDALEKALVFNKSLTENNFKFRGVKLLEVVIDE